MSDTNPAIDDVPSERPEADPKPASDEVGGDDEDAATAPALRRRDSGGAGVMS